MQTDWTIFIAFILFFVLILFVYRRWRQTTRSRERQFDTSINTPTVIGSVKWSALTRRQQQVARLAARGLSNAEIAHELGIKPTTVDAHLKNIYAALDVHSRAELAYRIKDYID